MELHDKEAEMALLGSMLIDTRCIPAVTTHVKHSDFYDPYHRQLFGALVIIHDANEPINDIVVLKRQLIAMSIEFDAATIGRIMTSVPTASNAEHYAGAVRELATRRQLLDLSRELASQAKDRAATLEEITSYARQYVELLQAGSTRNMPALVTDALGKLIEHAEQEQSTRSVPWGFPIIDHDFGKLIASELTTIGARPGGGKTTFSMQVAKYNADKGRRVLYASLEMGEVEFAARLACIELAIDSRDLRDGRCPPETVEKLKSLQSEWLSSGFPFYLWAPPRATEVEIESRAKWLHASGGLDLVIVDHLQLVKCTNQRLNRYEQIGQVTKRMKSLAKELDVPVIAQTQLKRSEARPTLSSARESGDIEQDCDNVCFLHQELDGKPEFIVEKFRQGDTGAVDLERGDNGKFVDPSVSEAFDFDGAN